MQDKAIAAIGALQLKKNKDLEPVDLYIENMFPGKDYQILLLVFEITNNNGELNCEYKGIDIERVGQGEEAYKKYAYRKGTSGRAGDITFTTKLSSLKKLRNIKDLQFPKLTQYEQFSKELGKFLLIEKQFTENYENINIEVKNKLNELPRNEKESLGISMRIKEGRSNKYLFDFNIIKSLIIDGYLKSKITQDNTESKTSNTKCSVSGEKEKDIYGFAAPFKYSSPDKPGFISGFFNKKKNWRNYPISSDEALKLELGQKFIKQNLSGYFYGYEYLIVPHPIIKAEIEKLKKIIKLITTAFETEKKETKEEKRRAEDRVQKTIAAEENYFNLDILFFQEDKKTQAINILLMLEEILPSRFRKLFIEAPEVINKNALFKDAITIKKGTQDLKFSFQIIKHFFDKDFLAVVQKIFLGKPLSPNFVFENIIKLYRKNYNAGKTSDNWTEPGLWTVKKAIMLLYYLQGLEIINYNKIYKYMETENIEKKKTTFNVEAFNRFIAENESFLDSNVKVGVFAVGILIRFLFDIQQANLNNTPFENKLRGYKLNPELLKYVYTEALAKIEAYQSFYVYEDLRQIINRYFIVNSNKLNALSNNELSFYFVAGLELGKTFKHEKEKINNQ